LTEFGDPVSWLLIERGWNVVAADGSALGRVEAVIGDSGTDIFDGLAIASSALSRPRYVPAERVRTIYEGRVELELPAEAAQALEPYEEPPPSETILPITASWWQRFLGRFQR
jgi:hypothetical protein